MKNKIISIIAILFAYSNSAYAQLNTRNQVELSDPVGGNILPGGKILEADNIRESFVFTQLVPFVIGYTIRIAVALSVLAIMIGGYQYMTAFGDEEKHKAAQKTLTYAALGLVLSITAYGLVTIITNLRIV